MHYTGKGATFPAHVNDVLGDKYGMCTDKNACFGRLPSWLKEEGTELLISDGTNTLKFTFSATNSVAHSAWQSFHDHEVGHVFNGQNWRPMLLNGSSFGSIHPGNADCWQ